MFSARSSKQSGKGCSMKAASLVYAQTQRKDGKGPGNSNRKMKVRSYLLVHLKPVNFYPKYGQTPAKVAQRSRGVSRTQLDVALSSLI